VGERVPLEEDEEGVEEAISIGLVTQIRHCFSHSPMEMTHIIVQAWLIAAITPEEGVASEDYYPC
jgi:hypothetical protein